MRLRSSAGFLAGAAAVALLAACSSSAADTAVSTSKAGVQVVASTNVYGDIVRQIAGDKAEVTSIISDPDQDPHSYEANAQTQLSLSKAKVVIENGGGYDDFVDTMLKSSGNTSAKVMNVVNISGHQAPAGGELNEHVWYDFPTVEKLAAQLASTLSEVDSANSSTYAANAAAFAGKVKQLEATEASIKAAHDGAGAAITEPVPLYLLTACGLVNKTPGEFSEAIEEGTDVPVAVLQETLTLFSAKQVKLLAYNEQTSGPETEKVLAAAKANGIAVVPVTETLPDGKDYLGWMTANLDAIRSALA
ncbi:metal ABC transporter solute-binding protein, Zn/Mn family [Kribbella pratensis]|uniref:Zinc/manganese transport system substrate-binding protein n=1 Tax=Kribbella pratensis TaxID=2512112 RepID=A0A4R8CJE0_9ACTN|nr:zinc ABC transporter substrate-binding protein [Kribbella pratensis]TDW76528.1 zinc/manganese transport system substrate-binding protein [Kribbella pratensis]